MQPPIVRFQKFCLRYAWIMSGIMGVFPLFSKVWPLSIPFFILGSYYYYLFSYKTLDETLQNTDVKKYNQKKILHGSNPEYAALDAYFFPFALLMGSGLIMYGFIISDKLGWL